MIMRMAAAVAMRRERCDFEPGLNFSKASAAYVLLNCSTYSTIRHDKQKSLNLELALFHPK
jgi:hypothetical protein